MEEILTAVKLRPGADALSEDLLKDIIQDSIYEVTEYTKTEELSNLAKSLVKDITIYKINRLGSEGVSSESFSGTSQSFIDGYPAEIKKKIRRVRGLSI